MVKVDFKFIGNDVLEKPKMVIDKEAASRLIKHSLAEQFLCSTFYASSEITSKKSANPSITSNEFVLSSESTYFIIISLEMN